MRREVEAGKRKMRLESYLVTVSAGAPTIGEGQYRGTIADNGVGDFTLTFTQAFSRVPVVVITPIAAAGAGDIIAVSVLPTASAVRINLFDATDGTTAKDASFMVLVVGADVVDEQ